MANIRKPVNNPLGGGSLPPTRGVMRPGLPNLPNRVTSEDTNSTNSGAEQSNASNSPVESQNASQAVTGGTPGLPRLTPSLPPLPGIPTRTPTTPQQDTSFSFPETEAEEPYTPNPMWEVDPDEVDPDYEDEEEVLISEEDDALITRLYFATDPEIATPTLYALVDDEDLEWEVAEALASNPATPEKFLEILAKHEDDLVRQAVMENESTSDELYATFKDDDDIMVLAAWIENPRTTHDQVMSLANHEDDYVRSVVKRSSLLTDSERASIKAE